MLGDEFVAYANRTIYVNSQYLLSARELLKKAVASKEQIQAINLIWTDKDKLNETYRISWLNSYSKKKDSVLANNEMLPDTHKTDYSLDEKAELLLHITENDSGKHKTVRIDSLDCILDIAKRAGLNIDSDGGYNFLELVSKQIYLHKNPKVADPLGISF